MKNGWINCPGFRKRYLSSPCRLPGIYQTSVGRWIWVHSSCIKVEVGESRPWRRREISMLKNLNLSKIRSKWHVYGMTSINQSRMLKYRNSQTRMLNRQHRIIEPPDLRVSRKSQSAKLIRSKSSAVTRWAEATWGMKDKALLHSCRWNHTSKRPHSASYRMPRMANWKSSRTMATRGSLGLAKRSAARVGSPRCIAILSAPLEALEKTSTMRTMICW